MTWDWRGVIQRDRAKQLARVPIENLRVVPCEACGTEGRFYTSNGNDPDWTDHGECPYCEGTGGELIEVQPIELEDLP
jgi:hypothetical protein